MDVVSKRSGCLLVHSWPTLEVPSSRGEAVSAFEVIDESIRWLEVSTSTELAVKVAYNVDEVGIGEEKLLLDEVCSNVIGDLRFFGICEYPSMFASLILMNGVVVRVECQVTLPLGEC